MKEFDKSLQYHIDNNLKKISPAHTQDISARQKLELQNCLDLHNKLESVKLKSAFGHRALNEALSAIDSEPTSHRRFQWNTLKLGATAMAGLLIVIVIGGFSWLGTTQNSSELSSDNVKPNGTIENLQNLNLADAENDSKSTQDDITNTAEINLANTSTIDEAINENF